MGKQRVEYRHGSDTGERNDPDAISPFNNGERVIDTVLNRSPENIRYRTEKSRTALEDQMYRSDTDMRWLMQSGAIAPSGDYYNGSIGKIIDWVPAAQGSGDPWNTPGDPYRGNFDIDTNISLESLLSIAKDAHHVETFYCENAVPPRNYTLTLTSRYQAAAGGDIVRINWAYNSTTTGVLNVSVSGDPKHVIDIEVSDDGSITLNQIEFALLGNPDAVNLLIISGSGDTGTTIDIGEIAPTAGEYPFNREQQREVHHITKAVLSAFFAGSYPGAPTGPGYILPNYLKDGDTLGVYYPYFEDPDAFFGTHADPNEVGGRRQATLTNNALATAPVEITPEQLFNSSIEPEKIPQSIPICKRIGDDLIFLDGTYVNSSVSSLVGGLYFGEHQYTVDRITSGATTILTTLTETWFGGVPLSSGSPATLEAAINAIIHDLADSSTGAGSALIGSDSSAGSGVSALTTPLATGSLFSQLVALQAGINARGALAFNETVTGQWEFDDVTTFGDYAHVLEGSWNKIYPAGAWDPFFRFNYDATTPGDVLWNTGSWWAYDGSVIMLRGCVPNGFGNFDAAPDDVGTGDALLVSLADGELTIRRRVGLAAGATFQFNVPALTFDLMTQDGLTGDWGPRLGGVLTLLDSGVVGNVGGRLVGKSSEESGTGHIKPIFETSSTAGQSGAYMYYADRALPDAGYDGLGSFLMVATNCRYVGGATGWVQNNSGAPSGMTVYSAYGTRRYYKTAGSGPWGTSSNPFSGWDDYVEVVPGDYASYTGTGDFNMWSAPFFFRQSVTSGGGTIVLQSGVDWRGRRAFASLTVSADSDFLNTTPAADVQNAINDVYACTRHVYFGNAGEASQYVFSRIYEGASPYPLQVGSGSSDQVTLAVNTTTGDLELSTASLTPVYVMGTIMPTLSL